MKLSVKAILMAILIFTASTVAGLIETSGMPSTGLAWSVLGLTTFFSVVAYSVQSFLLPSTSEQGQLNWLDILKGGIVAACNAGSAFLAGNVLGAAIDWKGVLGATGAVLIGYLIKQFKSAPIGIPPTK